jgi:ParB/RepB/Spo0J family partition protein
MPSFDLPAEDDVPSPAPLSALREANRVISKIRVDLLVDSPYQPRLHYDDAKLAELAESLRGRQIDPLSVRPLPDGKFEIISGHRRKRAAPLAQLEDLDCIVLMVSDSEARILVLAANEPHEDFTDYERALAYQAVLDDGRSGGTVRTQRQLADKVGVAVSLVNRRLSMLQLPSSIKEILQKHPSAFTSKWVQKLIGLTSMPHDEARLKAELVRVADGQLQMAALFSIMASARAGREQALSPQRGLSLQRGNRLFAQVTPNSDKRQVVVKLPGDCDIDEVAGLILVAIDQRFASSK